MNIVSQENGVPVLQNNRGCKLVAYTDGELFGFGTLYFDGAKVGGTLKHFIVEESVGTTFRASSYEVVENSVERGKVRFSGKDGKLDFSVTITLACDSTAYVIEYEFDPVHPIYHPLYLDMPFDSSNAQFVKYPFEDTLTPESKRRWSIVPDRGRVPFLFGAENVAGKVCFVGVGYSLNDDFTGGRFEYDPLAFPYSPLKIYTPFQGMARPVDLQCVTRLELLHVDLEEKRRQVRRDFRVIISTAGNQYDCVRGYIEHGGFDPFVPLRRSIDDSVAALLRLYKNIPGYIKGKGYTQLVRLDTGETDTTIPHGWYSKYILISPQLQLAYELYRHWESNPSEDWARTRAIEMADFAVRMQASNGGFTSWDTDTSGTSVIHPQNVEGTKFTPHVYSTADISMGTLHLYKLYNEMKAFEGVEHSEWKEAAIKAVQYLATLIGPDGEMGRNYSINGTYDKQNTCVADVLCALDYVQAQTGDAQLGQARDRLEAWIYERYIKVNNWCNGSVDGGAWAGAGWPPPHNNDNMGVLSFATYCAYRHMATGEEKYLQMAKDAVAYQWLTVVPVQIPGCTRSTKGLHREQDFYSPYDVPFKGKEVIDCLPYLSKVTGDSFFIKYYRMMVQTQMDYQAMDKPFPGFYIGLESDGTGREPIDTLAEEKVGYIIRFASVFLKSVSSPNTYRYVGGEGWGVGLDYNLAFNPNLGSDAPYVQSAATLVRDLSWDSARGLLSVVLYDRLGRGGTLDVKWKPDLYPVAGAHITVNGEALQVADLYDAKRQVVSLKYKHEQPTMVINFHCLGVPK